MDTKLTDEAARVLGCLVEKELATPEYYPLSLNGLVSACNQKNNREPIMEVEQADVADALDELRQAGLALQAAESARVPRYGHNLRGKLHLDDEQIAILGELLLRGPQTAGELRGRASRLHAFPDVDAVERVLQRLIQREPPLVAQLPVQPGRKEHRYAQLMNGDASAEAPAIARPRPGDALHTRRGPEPLARGDEWAPRPPPPPPERAAAPVPDHAAPAQGETARLARLEQELRQLQTEVEALRREVRALRRPGD